MIPYLKRNTIECENKAGALISALNDAGHKNLDSKNTSSKRRQIK